VRFDGNRYSVPPTLVRKTLLLRASPHAVRIFDQGQEVVCHERCYEKSQLLVHPDHRLAALKLRHRRQASQREEEFDALGPAAREFHLKLLSMPVKPTVHLRRLLGLVRLYGRRDVLAALSQALQYQTYLCPCQLAGVGFSGGVGFDTAFRLFGTSGKRLAGGAGGGNERPCSPARCGRKLSQDACRRWSKSNLTLSA
jgi:hypothetical protein